MSLASDMAAPVRRCEQRLCGKRMSLAGAKLPASSFRALTPRSNLRPGKARSSNWIFIVSALTLAARPIFPNQLHFREGIQVRQNCRQLPFSLTERMSFRGRSCGGVCPEDPALHTRRCKRRLCNFLP